MSQKFNHFHLVRNRPWPLLASLTAGMITYSTILMITSKGNFYFFFSISMSTLVGILWWRDVIRESTQEGSHTYYVVGGLKVGIIMFITSEILFFVSFFWAYLHSRISPRLELGAHWPPLSISTFNPMGIPLLNTVILLSSGVRVTWSHHSIENSKLLSSKTSIVFTIFLGILFTLLQVIEYLQAPFSISDSVFGTTFFLSTGFHGIHVIIGTLFLAVSSKRLFSLSFSSKHLLGFECSAWYWHFVDVVWLFLYTLIYWWGSYFKS